MNTAITNISKDRLHALILCLLSYCYIHFVIWTPSGFFTTIYYIILASFFTASAVMNGIRVTRHQKTVFVLILLFSTVFTLSASSFVHSLVNCFLFLTGIYFIYSLYHEDSHLSEYFFLDLIRAGLLYPFHSFGKIFPVLATTGEHKKTIGRNVLILLSGFLVLLPFTILISILLMSADSGVESILSTFFSLQIFDGILIMKILFSIPVTLYLFGAYFSNRIGYIPVLFGETKNPQILQKLRKIPALFFYSGVAPVLFLYVIYFISQFQYYTGAFLGRLPEEFSYAEYARKGFFELCMVAVLNLLLLAGIKITASCKDRWNCQILKCYNTVLSIFTLLILSTAFCKMIMYIRAYGLTPLRVYTTWFMILLAIIFVLILLGEWIGQFRVIRASVISFLILFAILCFSNIDRQIAKYNVHAAAQGTIQELDLQSLSGLSDDAAYYLTTHGFHAYDADLLERMEENPYTRYHVSSFRLYRYLTL